MIIEMVGGHNEGRRRIIEENDDVGKLGTMVNDDDWSMCSSRVEHVKRWCPQEILKI
jgi:hypothetical protein